MLGFDKTRLRNPGLWGGCVGAWNPGLGISGSTLKDNSGANNYGVLTNGPIWKPSQGAYALSFDGTDDYVNLKSPPVLDDLVAMTWAAWIYTNSVTTRQTLLWKGNDVSSIASKLFELTAAGQLRARFTATVSADVSAGTLLERTWYHVAVTFDNNGDRKLRLYLNGVLIGTSAAATGTRDDDSAHEMWIGNRIASGGIPFNGLITDVMVFNTTLEKRLQQLSLRRGIAYETVQRRSRKAAAAGGASVPIFAHHYRTLARA